MFNTQTTTQHATNLETEEHTEVSIDALGRIKVEGKNYTGDACTILGEKLNRAFGGGGDKKDKPEAFEDNHAHVPEGQNW